MTYYAAPETKLQFFRCPLPRPMKPNSQLLQEQSLKHHRQLLCHSIFHDFKHSSNAKRSRAEDHVWLLREDPSYFLATVLEWSEHRPEHILSFRNETHPELGKPIFWDRLLRHVILNAYESLAICENRRNLQFTRQLK